MFIDGNMDYNAELSLLLGRFYFTINNASYAFLVFVVTSVSLKFATSVFRLTLTNMLQLNIHICYSISVYFIRRY